MRQKNTNETFTDEGLQRRNVPVSCSLGLHIKNVITPLDKPFIPVNVT